MIDVMNRNPLTITGTPSLVTGALTVDTDQALQFNGTTNSGSVTDSPSLSITSSMSLECFVKFAALPGSTKDLVAKASSYSLQLNSAGKLLWKLDNGASTVTVTSTATLSTNTWYHVICVYNDNYAGAEEFGNSTQGSATTPVVGDFFQGSATGSSNKVVSSFVLQEQALIDNVLMDLLRDDGTLGMTMRAVIYTDTAGVPDVLAGQSADVNFAYPAPTRAWYSFPISVLLPADTYWLGYMGGESSQEISIGQETSGGSTAKRNDLLSDGASDPFGSVTTSTAEKLAVYATYTSTSRTGLEGKAIIYINGALDNSSAYTGDIADNANAVSICPSFAASVDDVSIWDRALSTVEAATHYTAH